jgi:mono/diheme cytochrome c family protein
VSPVTGYATLTGVRAVNDPSATNVAQTVINGVNRKTTEGKIFMPAFGEGYSDDDIAAVANYVTARFGAEGAHLTGNDVANLRKQATQHPKSQEAPNG